MEQLLLLIETTNAYRTWVNKYTLILEFGTINQKMAWLSKNFESLQKIARFADFVNNNRNMLVIQLLEYSNIDEFGKFVKQYE